MNTVLHPQLGLNCPDKELIGTIVPLVVTRDLQAEQSGLEDFLLCCTSFGNQIFMEP